MMAFEQKDFEGVLFKNEDRNGDTDRHYSGNALIKGEDYWLSAWINTARSGKKYMKLKFEPKVVSEDDADLFDEEETTTKGPEPDDDVPF